MELNKDYFIKCITKKKIAQRNSDYIRQLAVISKPKYGLQFKKRLETRANRIVQCLNYWEWDKYEKNKVLDLKKLFRCKDMFCPNCRSWNSAKSIIKFMPFFKDMILKGYHPYFMTLTVPNIEGKDLGKEIDKLNKAYSKIWTWLSYDNGSGSHRVGFKDRLFTGIGSIRVIEMTVNKKNRSFNVHIHALIFLDGYYTNEFVKIHEGGFRYKSNENIYYSDADIFIQKLWTMAYKNFSIKKFGEMSNDWRDNFICDIRELEMPGGIYEIFKYCFKDMNINDIELFDYIFFGLMNRRTRQGYGSLFKMNKELKDKDIEIEMSSENLLDKYLKIDELPEILRVHAICEMETTYKDYIKISRFRTDEEYENIKD